MHAPLGHVQYAAKQLGCEVPPSCLTWDPALRLYVWIYSFGPLPEPSPVPLGKQSWSRPVLDHLLPATSRSGPAKCLYRKPIRSNHPSLVTALTPLTAHRNKTGQPHAALPPNSSVAGPAASPHPIYDTQGMDRTARHGQRLLRHPSSYFRVDISRVGFSQMRPMSDDDTRAPCGTGQGARSRGSLGHGSHPG